MNRVNKIIVALECILFLSGCISNIPLDIQRNKKIELSGTRWILQSMNGRALLEDTAITLKFSEEGISGWSGCNFYFAGYSIQTNNGIEINELANTAMGCPEPAGILEQEKGYLNSLRSATSYDLEGETLFVSDEHGNILLQYRILPKFEADADGLIGKTWRLEYADGMKGYELDAFTLWFDGSTFGGTTSCRDYEGTYQIVEDSIRVMMLVMMSDEACGQVEWKAEPTYTTLLERIEQYNVSENWLELYTVQNDKLIFKSVSGD